MEIIQNIFGLVLEFGMQLSSGVWRAAAAADDDVSTTRATLRHSQYEQICKTHGAFKEHAAFLFKGLQCFGALFL